MSDNDSTLSSFFAGFAIGSLVGAVTALILAPQSGEATRRRISDMGADVRQAGEERYETVRQSVDTYVDRAGETIADTRSRAEHLGEQAKNMRIVIDEGKDENSAENSS